MTSSDKDFTIDLVEDSTDDTKEVSMWDHVILTNPDVAGRYQPV